MEKLPCKECGAMILPATAKRTNGLCMPCKKNARLNEPDLFSGGDGASFETAVVIQVDDPSVGVRAEHAYIESQCGQPHMDWQLELQQIRKHNGKPYDVFKITLNNGQERLFYFDISTFYGK